MMRSPCEGQAVWLSWHPMLARNVHITEREGKAHVSCHGAMVDGGENTPLMHTSYNGGWYGHYVGPSIAPTTHPRGSAPAPRTEKE